MKKFTYTIQDDLGIHARPAGMLAKEAKKYNATITLQVEKRSAEATHLMAVMGLGVKKGTEVIVTVEGADEKAAMDGMQKFFRENL